MADTREFFDENLVGLSDPEKYNLYGGLAEMADELSALHDQMNKLEAALAEIGQDMRELRKSLRVARAAPKLPELRIKSRQRQPAADVHSSAPPEITKGKLPTKP
jgi:chromosome segregation ATPase